METRTDHDSSRFAIPPCLARDPAHCLQSFSQSSKWPTLPPPSCTLCPRRASTRCSTSRRFTPTRQSAARSGASRCAGRVCSAELVSRRGHWKFFRAHPSADRARHRPLAVLSTGLVRECATFCATQAQGWANVCRSGFERLAGGADETSRAGRGGHLRNQA